MKLHQHYQCVASASIDVISILYMRLHINGHIKEISTQAISESRTA